MSQVRLVFLAWWHLGMLMWQHYTDIVLWWIWVHVYWPYFLENSSWHMASRVSLSTSSCKYIFCLYLWIYHTEWCEAPSVLGRWYKVFGMPCGGVVVPKTVTHGGLFTYTLNPPPLINYDCNVNFLKIGSCCFRHWWRPLPPPTHTCLLNFYWWIMKNIPEAC